jgi:hypothetical protein
MAADFPENIRRFLTDHINSVEQLEVLFLLRKAADREWTAAAVSQALYTPPDSAARRLADLRSLGLLTATEGPDPAYRYQPATEGLAQLADQLAQVYEERRVTVISLIYSKPHANVQAFADAFRLRKEKG